MPWLTAALHKLAHFLLVFFLNVMVKFVNKYSPFGKLIFFSNYFREKHFYTLKNNVWLINALLTNHIIDNIRA